MFYWRQQNKIAVFFTIFAKVIAPILVSLLITAVLPNEIGSLYHIECQVSKVLVSCQANAPLQAKMFFSKIDHLAKWRKNSLFSQQT